MNEQSINSSSTNDLPRCQHRTPTGRRCRHAVSSIKTGLCSTHAPAHANRSEESDLSAHLTAGLTEFKSAVPINEFLSRLLHLEAEDRVSPRRAAVMAYTCNLILRTLPAVDEELHPEKYDDTVHIDFGDLPRPGRAPRPDYPANSIPAKPNHHGHAFIHLRSRTDPCRGAAPLRPLCGTAIPGCALRPYSPAIGAQGQTSGPDRSTAREQET